MKHEEANTPNQQHPTSTDNTTSAEAPVQDVAPEQEAAESPAQGGDDKSEGKAAKEDDVIAALVNELKEAKKAVDEAQDNALRAQAELQNFRRRKERETSERIAQANANLILELLPVLDDFERAFENIPEGISPEETAWAEGFALILRKLQSVLERQGVSPIDATGTFDPNIHEAISVEPSDEVESGEIIAEVRRGYKLNDKVLRPSFVRVAQ